MLKKQGKVALVQRYIPHYRFPLFEKLHTSSRYDWIFFCDGHPGGEASGLEAPDLGDLNIRRIDNTRIFGPLVWQRGLGASSREFDALMIDLSWTIISNPYHLIRARHNGISTIGWSKGIAKASSANKTSFRRFLERQIARHCDSLVAYGNISHDYFLRLGFPSDRILIARNTVDVHQISKDRSNAIKLSHQIRDSLNLDQRPIVGFLGKIAPFKKVDKIIHAFEIVRRRGVSAQLIIAGDGPTRPAIEKMVKRSPFHADITCIHEVPPGIEAGYFQLFDLYLSYSQSGLGIMEAMAHARPVLVTPEKYPETELLLDNQTGFICEESKVESFAAKMRQALQNDKQRKIVGRHAESQVLTHATQEAMVIQIDLAVEKAISTRRGGCLR